MSDKKFDPASPAGLVFNMPGAPETPHVIVGIRGIYRPDSPTPIGGEGEVTLEEAQAAIEAGAPLELVNIPKKDLDQVREQFAADLAAARTGAVQARQDGPVGAEAGVLNDHVEAVKD